MRVLFAFAAVVAFSLTVGCDAGPKSPRGFTLPDGNVAQGKAEFLALRCYECHSVSGVELPSRQESNQVVVALGGEVSRIKTYGELVTSIINPSHKLADGFAPETLADDGQSKMKNYNKTMTVSQLIDLVAFLQSRYELKEYEPTDYPMYGY